MKPRRLVEHERQLWLDTMREVRPLRKPGPATPDPGTAIDGGASSAAAAGSPVAVPDRERIRRALPAPRPPVEIGAREGGIDTSSWRALSSGKLRPQRRLDLHGQTAQPAFNMLHAFLLQAQAERLRCVEIITGAGSGPNGGILRRELPHWLSRADLRPLVLAAVHPHARNVGSVRLLLRRRAG